MPLIKNIKIRTTLEQLQTLFLCLFAGTLCFNPPLNHGILITALFISLILFDKNILRKNLKAVLILCSGYVTAVVSSAYSSDKTEALFVLEKQLTLFFVPLILGSSFEGNIFKLKLVVWSFITSVFFACGYLLLYFFTVYQVLKNHVSVQDFINMQLHHNFSMPLKLHATYLSIYVCFSIACTLYFLFNDSRFYKIIAFIFLPVFILSFILLSSRIVFIPFILIIFFVLPFFIRRKFVFVYFILLISSFLFMFYLLRNFTAFEARFKTDTLRELNLKPGTDKMFSFESITASNDATRAERWKCAVELIRERPIVGYGTGDEKKMLSEKYVKYDLTNSSVNNFDSHNQYFAFMIKSGFFGIFTFLLLLVFSFFIAIKYRNYMQICLLFIVIITCLTENVLESNKGILFFAFFNSVFVMGISGNNSREKLAINH